MRQIKLDSVEITRDGQKTKEFAAVFAYEHLEEIAKQLVIEKLRETGELEGLNQRQIRVESRYCEPDGDMGWRGSRVQIVLMFGAGNYYPHLMEQSYAKQSRTKLSSVSPSDIADKPKFWARFKGLFRKKPESVG